MIKNNFKTEAMKTIIYTIIALLALNASLLIAGDINHPTTNPEPVKNALFAIPDKIAPITPLVADFDDGTDVKASPEIFIAKIAPVTPREADFDDESGLVSVIIDKIAPVTPKDPEFEDQEIDMYPNASQLSPHPPAVADFAK
jgi:hypothetical protein